MRRGVMLLALVAACGGSAPRAQEPTAEAAPATAHAEGRPKCADAAAHAFLKEQRAHAAARRDDACAHHTDDCAAEQRTVDLMDQSLAQDPCAGAAP